MVGVCLSSSLKVKVAPVAVVVEDETETEALATPIVAEKSKQPVVVDNSPTVVKPVIDTSLVVTPMIATETIKTMPQRGW